MLNNFQPVPQPTVHTPQITHDDATHQRKSAYAAMSDLQDRFNEAGIDTEQVWECIKAEHGVDSRAKFTGFQWARIAAELQGARRDDVLFKILLDRIPDPYFRIHVYPDDPNVPIGRPRDTRKHHIADEWGDFQQMATDNQCLITVTQGKRTTYYEPNAERAIAQANPTGEKHGGDRRSNNFKEISNPLENEPPVKPETKPVVSLDTNARGEVLNAFGDVEVQHA